MTTEQPTIGITGIVGRDVDGDTVRIWVKTTNLLGIDGMLDYNVRLIGINAPEKYTPGGKRAKTWLTAFAVGKPCLLEIIGFDKFGGRVDGNVWLSGDTQTLQQHLVANGHAVEWNGVGPKPVLPEWST